MKNQTNVVVAPAASLDARIAFVSHARVNKKVPYYDPRVHADFVGIAIVWGPYTGIPWENNMEVAVVSKSTRMDAKPRSVQPHCATREVIITAAQIRKELYIKVDAGKIEMCSRQETSDTLEHSLFERLPLLAFIDSFLNDVIDKANKLT